MRIPPDAGGGPAVGATTPDPRHDSDDTRSPGGWDLRLPARPAGAKPVSGKRTRSDLAFLPAALEVAHTPAHPAARVLALLLCAFLLLAVAWSYFGHVDVVAVAEGKLVPVGRVKLVQPLGAGVVRAIHVVEGQEVAAGDLLVELDPTETTADVIGLENDLAARRAAIARLRALLAAPDDPASAFQVPPDSSDELLMIQYDLMVAEVRDHQANLDGLTRQVAQREADVAATRATIDRLESMLPLSTELADMYRDLADQQLVARTRYLSTEQERVSTAKELIAERHRLTEALAAVDVARHEFAKAQQDFTEGVLEELAEAEREARTLTKQLAKARRKSARQALTAPIAGTVHKLAMHTVGGVVTPAAELMAIVPDSDRLIVEATLPNKDAGFVAVGQEAEIKVSAFPFTRHGLLRGTVTHLARDATVVQSEDQQERAGYLVQASVDPEASDPDLAERVGFGMDVALEIKTDRRRVIAYLLDPILTTRQEAWRER